MWSHCKGTENMSPSLKKRLQVLKKSFNEIANSCSKALSVEVNDKTRATVIDFAVGIGKV
jgi:hypothetical protein